MPFREIPLAQTISSQDFSAMYSCHIFVNMNVTIFFQSFVFILKSLALITFTFEGTNIKRKGFNDFQFFFIFDVLFQYLWYQKTSRLMCMMSRQLKLYLCGAIRTRGLSQALHLYLSTILIS